MPWILFWLTMITVYSFNSADDRIFNGIQVNVKVSPYIVSVQLSGAHICGGSIISESVVLTAAHCFQKESNANKYSIQYGVTHIGGTENIIRVSSFRRHPKFNDLSKDYDVGLLYLVAAITAYRPIALAGYRPRIGTAALVSGWGVVEENGELQTSLRAVTVHTVRQLDCSRKYKPVRITPRMLCAGEPFGGKDACIGDSGGPLVVDGVQVGIVSFGTGCGRREFPGVYTNVAMLRSWIRTYMMRKPGLY
ncbi:trypsin-7-like [Rhagoletis pomonella]|uniref:trypsin-7-like n=1 Tax=Rhagoletis pomonella TaxID=28610 RepID=UPI00177B9B61|nr:trypsin-7-like [Rhagoletis pomonella]